MNISFPFFSIIVPTCNRPRQLSDCLQALSQLNYPKERFEIIIVDDGSTAPLAPVVEQCVDMPHCTVVRQANAGPGVARNTGVTKANGQFIAFTDDDCLPAPDWLHRLAEEFALTPDSLIGGKIVNALEDNIYSTASQTLISFLYSYYNCTLNNARFFTSNNMALAKKHFLTIGGFKDDFVTNTAEDREFCDHWKSLGHSMVFAPNAVVYHQHQLSFIAFWRQHFAYGRGAYYYHKVQAQLGNQKFKVEPLSAFYFGLLRYPFQKTSKKRAIFLSALMVVAQTANVCGYFWERAKHIFVKPQLPAKKKLVVKEGFGNE